MTRTMPPFALLGFLRIGGIPAAAFLCLALAFAAGCAPTGLRKLEPLPLSSSMERAAKLRERSEHWKIYQARMKVRSREKDGVYRFTALVTARLPEHVRIEASNLWGQTLGLLVVNPAGASLWIASENLLYTARKPDLLVQKLFGLPIPSGVLAYGLPGCVPPDHVEGQWRSHYGDSPWTGFVHAASPGASYTWKFVPRSGALAEVDVADSSSSYSIRYTPPVSLDPDAFPREISFFTSPSQWQTRLLVDEMRRGESLPADLFRMPSLEGVRTLSLDE